MRDFVRCFLRHGSGAWECVKPGVLELPTGRIEVAPGTVFVPGTKFMNVDLAGLLERHYDEKSRAGGL